MTGIANQADWTTAGGAHNALAFLVHQMLGGLWTGTLVQIKACTNSGGLAPTGTVDVQPLVNMVDGDGNSTPHGILNGLLYFRMQGGSNAVIMDPSPGDIGWAVFASRDISAVKATKAQANPGSFRRFDAPDGMYIGGVLNGIPMQYALFSAGGISLVSPTAVTVQAPTITLDGNVVTTGTLRNNGVNVGSTHDHGNVENGEGVTGPPQ
jgi:hypothetical protein